MASKAVVTRRRKGRRGGNGAQKAGAVGQYATDAWSLAKRTAVGLNEIRKLINIETKFLTNYHAIAAILPAGDTFCVSELAQGLTSTTRVGDSIRNQHFEVTGHVEISAAAITSSVRVVVFRDLDGYGTAPTAADVLEQTGGNSSTLSTPRFNRRERFSILFDELFVLSTSDPRAVFHYEATQLGHTLFLSALAAPAADGKGSIYVMQVSDEDVNTPNGLFYSRLLFTDD